MIKKITAIAMLILLAVLPKVSAEQIAQNENIQKNIPNLTVDEIPVYCADINVCSFRYRITNTTEDSINNLLVYSSNYDISNAENAQQFDRSIEYISLKTGEEIVLSFSSLSDKDTYIYIGYAENDTFHYRSFVREANTYRDEKILEVTYTFSEEAYSYSLNSPQIEAINALPKAEVILTATPQATAEPTASPIPTEQSTTVDSTIYRPPYFYFAWAVVVLVVFLIGVIVWRWVLLRKSNVDEEDEQR